MIPSFIILAMLLIVANATDVDLASQSPMYGMMMSTKTTELDVHSSCTRLLVDIAHALGNREKWAFKLMDASGVPGSGFYWGNTYWLGSKIQCIESAQPSQLVLSERLGYLAQDTPEDAIPFPVGFFAAYFRHSSSMQLRLHWSNEDLITLGLCLPAACNPHQIGELLQEYFDSRQLLMQKIYKTDFHVERVKLTTGEVKWIYESPCKEIIWVLFALCALSFSGTLYECLHYKHTKIFKTTSKESQAYDQPENIKYKHTLEDTRNSLNKNEGSNVLFEYKSLEPQVRVRTWQNVILAFSVTSNTKSLFSQKMPEGSVPAIHGLKFLCMVYVICTHSGIFGLDQFENRYAVHITSTRMIYEFITNAFTVIETYFLIGGFLLGHLYFYFDQPSKRKIETKDSVLRRFKMAVTTIIKRYLRITPCHMLTIGLAILNSTWRENSSVHWSSERNDLICRKFWWRNLLYINNLYPRAEMCLSWSWYMSNDMQFCVIGVILCSITALNSKLGVRIGILLVTICSTVSWLQIYGNNMMPTLDEIYAAMHIMYDPPWARMTPYFIGLYLGYYYNKIGRELTLSKTFRVAAWIISPLLVMGTLFGLHHRELGPAATASYFVFARIAWSLGFGWIIMACATQNGGFVNSFLSSKEFTPFSKLTFGAFLLNPLIIYSTYSFSQKSWNIEGFLLIFYALSFMVMTYFMAFVISVLVETPCTRLTKLLFDAFNKPKKVKIHTTIANEEDSDFKKE